MTEATRDTVVQEMMDIFINTTTILSDLHGDQADGLNGAGSNARLRVMLQTLHESIHAFGIRRGRLQEEFIDGPEDWHCTAEARMIALAALAERALTTDPAEDDGEPFPDRVALSFLLLDFQGWAESIIHEAVET